MHQADRVTHLVRRQLPEPRERHLRERLGGRVFVLERRQKALGDEEVLPDAQGTERHDALQDLACPRIGHGTAVGPPARRPVDPLDHVVADVERVGALRQQFHPERVHVPRRLEGLVPPARAVEQRRPDRFRRAPVEVVDDRFDRLAPLRPRVPFPQPVADDVARLERRIDRSRVVQVARRDVAGAGIGQARLVPRLGQRDEGVPQPHRHRLRRRGDLAHPPARAAAVRAQHERLHALELRVARERGDAGAMDRRPRGVQLVAALAAPLEPGRHAVRVAQHELGGVEQRRSVFVLGGDLESPEHGTGEGVGHRAAFVLVVAERPVARVLLHQQHLRPHPLESRQVGSADLAAVEPDVVRPETRRQRLDVQEVGVEGVDAQEEPTAHRRPRTGRRSRAGARSPRWPRRSTASSSGGA